MAAVVRGKKRRQERRKKKKGEDERRRVIIFFFSLLAANAGGFGRFAAHTERDAGVLQQPDAERPHGDAFLSRPPLPHVAGALGDVVVAEPAPNSSVGHKPAEHGLRLRPRGVRHVSERQLLHGFWRPFRVGHLPGEAEQCGVQRG